MVLALLAGLLLVAAIETDISDRLMGVIFPAPVGTSSPVSSAASSPEKKESDPATESGISVTNTTNQQPVEKVIWKGTIQRNSSELAGTAAGLDSLPATEDELKDPGNR